MSRILQALLLSFCMLSAVPAHAVTLSKGRGAGAFAAGFVSVSQGAAWANLIPTQFKRLTAGAISAGDYVVDLSIKNTHATQTLYLLFRPHANEAVTAAYPLGPGAELALSDLIWAANGSPITTIAVRGSGAGTTALLVCTFSRGQ